MKIRVPDYFKEFNCIASACLDTCCAGWEVVIDNETYNKYKSIGGEFGHRLRSEIVNKDGENIFILKGDNCPFLNSNKMCDIYIELGEEGLCYTCKRYPRYMEEFGGLREIGISLSCPEAARIILQDSKKAEFEESEVQEEITSYNDIGPMLFINLMKSRKIVIDILQNREIKLEERISLVLKLSEELQQSIDRDNISRIKESIGKYANSDFINLEVKKLEKHRVKGNAKYYNTIEIIKVFKALKHINSNDPLCLEELINCFYLKEDEGFYLDKHKQFEKYYEEKFFKFENMLVYFVFRYYMKAVFDYDVAAKIKTAAVSYIMLRELFVLRWLKKGELKDADAVDIMHMYSKDIEHLEENLEALAEIFKTNNIFKLSELIAILMN